LHVARLGRNTRFLMFTRFVCALALAAAWLLPAPASAQIT
jgi:hypothetical protein